MNVPEFIVVPDANPVILLITPPLMQPNTPYPATPALTGFLKDHGFSALQADLGIELLDRVFSAEGLNEVFEAGSLYSGEWPDQLRRINNLRQQYIDTIDEVMAFLRAPSTDRAIRIANRDWLPESAHFQTSIDLDWAFGPVGIVDKAKFLATRYLQDISDFITLTVSPHFSLIRYGERLSVSLPLFDPMQEALQAAPSLPDRWMTELLENHIHRVKPALVGFTVPFPGNLYGALRCCQYLRQQFPSILTVIGGGYPGTELRSMRDARIFDFVHLVSIDDGFSPLLSLASLLRGEGDFSAVPSVAFRSHDAVVYQPSAAKTPDARFAELPPPDYTGLPLDRYIPLLDTANPMHRLWSDGRWNKLTLAHGCYWHGCAFCDTALGYIGRYEPSTASAVADTMEHVMKQTGSHGFHFTDEAAPPALIRELCLEILNRGLQVSWWTNIRFEKSFTPDLCRLMSLAGCIAVTGGIETASDRLLKLMNKGVTIEQATLSCRNFTRAGIMVHAYLMYGFPTQSVQETIDALEIVRQLFAEGIVRSAFWHRFALTVHSPVGADPARFGIEISENKPHEFANNELIFKEKRRVDHDQFGEGLRTSLYNYMQGLGFDMPVNQWFDDKTPPPRVPHDLIRMHCQQPATAVPTSQQRVVWPGWPVMPGNQQGKFDQLVVDTLQKTLYLKVPKGLGATLTGLLRPQPHQRVAIISVDDFVARVGQVLPDEAGLIWTERWMNRLREAGLLIV